ncbi:MAG: hypothetical protein EBR82_76830 [Caulobacteraceae bacterium]|nr:hypothetical protein [Caulobacteraceae bacterium]
MTTKNNTQAASVKDGRAEALAEFLGCSVDELSLERHDHYGLETYSFGREEYAVGTDEEADEACIRYVRENAWAFRPSFICEYCNLPHELEEALEIMQSKKCEEANDAILALINKANGGIDGFADVAVAADGRGHLLSSYDGNENEEKGFFIYRIN